MYIPLKFKYCRDLCLVCLNSLRVTKHLPSHLIIRHFTVVFSFKLSTQQNIHVLFNLQFYLRLNLISIVMGYLKLLLIVNIYESILVKFQLKLIFVHLIYSIDQTMFLLVGFVQA